MTLLRCNFCRTMLNGTVLQLIKTESPNGATIQTAKTIVITSNTKLTNLFCNQECVVKHIKYQQRLKGLSLENLNSNSMYQMKNLRFTEYGICGKDNNTSRWYIVGKDRVIDRKKIKIITGCYEEWVLTSYPAKYIFQALPSNNKLPMLLPERCGEVI